MHAHVCKAVGCHGTGHKNRHIAHVNNWPSKHLCVGKGRQQHKLRIVMQRQGAHRVHAYAYTCQCFI